jgi:serine/threonine-protein kinase
MKLNEPRVDTSAADTTPAVDTMSAAPTLAADTGGLRALADLAELGRARADAGAGLRIEGTLGEGGMGVVRLATQVALGRHVAVKTLRPELRSEGASLRLLREAWVTGALEHPNVVPVYDVALDDAGAPVIVLKRIEGVAWSELLRDGAAVEARFGASELLEWNLQILMQVCNAVHFAHSRGIVHRDLKPDNVMIGGFGEVYVLDWGIAVSLHDDGSGRLPLAADARDPAGTLAYIAPEMFGDGAISPRTDVYLLGATLYEILALRPPHNGATLDAVRTQAHLSEPPLPPDAPEELGRICLRAMAADPDARFESALQLRLALQGFLHRRGSSLIAAEATRRLEQLVRALGAGGGERLQLYNLFGEARFGFEQALRSWPNNAAAAAGLKRATEAMVDYELALGDVRAAALLLAGVAEPTPALAARVAAAEQAHAEAEARNREHERVARLHDASIGRRARRFLAAGLGCLWVAVSIACGLLMPPEGSRAMLFAVPSVLLLFTLVVGLSMRDTLGETLVNRWLYATVALALSTELLLQLGLWRLGVAPQPSGVIGILPFVICSACATLVERRLVWGAVAFAGAFAVAAVRPALGWDALAVASAVITASMVVIWRPSRGEPRDSVCIVAGDRDARAS